MSPDKKLFNAIVASAILFGCGSAEDKVEASMDKQQSSKELIVLAAPGHDDPYYADVADDIFDFHIAYARKASEKDSVLVLTDAASRDAYVDALGEDKVAIAPMGDIWMRDFGLSHATNPVMFRYTAAGQGGGQTGQVDADAVQETLAVVTDEAGVAYQASDLFNDGGNFVDDYYGRAVISRKFLRDNKLSETEARDALSELTDLKHIAFIEADEQGGLEHADGVVAFIGPNILVVNSYPDDTTYAEQLHNDLKRGLPGVTIHEIVTPYDGAEIYDDRFGSACGLYTNMLVTPERIYFPQFGIPEDAEAVAQISQWTDREIIPIRSDQVCHMGGGVRCMSWQLRGDNAARLKAHLTK